jgi:homoserine O-acetyltransferase
MTIDPGLFEEGERMRPSGDRQIFDVGDLTLDSGAILSNVQLAYQIFGQPLGSAPVILVCHAISGDSNAVGWWPRLIGEGLAIDLTKYTVLCSNALGGCQGSTGPSSLASDGKSYGSRFPRISMWDIVHAQAKLIHGLGISKLKMVCGGSMGGMQALAWADLFPDMVERAWVTASAGKHSAMQLGFNEVARQAIMRDPKWCSGDYDPSDPPIEGLALARMLGHLTYLSPEAFDAKFSRESRTNPDPNNNLLPERLFEIASYLRYQGQKFTQRFDANSLLSLSSALDSFDCSSFSPGVKYLFTSFSSDWIYLPSQSESLHLGAISAGCQSRWLNIDSPLGHDAFLLDDQEQAQAVREFLAGA